MPNPLPTSRLLALASVLLAAICLQVPGAAARPSAPRQAPRVPQFGVGQPVLTVIGADRDGLEAPRDLAFHPERPNELWTVNQATDGTVIYFNAGMPDQRSEKRVDRFASHFMADVSAISFDRKNSFATCQESRNGATMNAMGNDFMGPTLWTADLDIYAKVNQRYEELSDLQVQLLLHDRMCGTHVQVPERMQPGRSGLATSRADGAPAVPDQAKLGSHIDMNHESPLCLGIEHEAGNVYWVTDGMSGNLVRYDFAEDHGPGNDDHSDAIIRRYPQALVSRVPGVPSHLALDRATGYLYYTDTGAHVVRRINTRSGAKSRALRVTDEIVAEYSEYRGLEMDAFVAQGLNEPSGIAVYGGMLFVGDHKTGDISAYDLADGQQLGRLATGSRGLMGLTVGPDGKLWYVDAAANTVIRVDPKGVTLPTATSAPTEALEPTPTAPLPTLAPTSPPTLPPTAIPTVRPTPSHTPRPTATPTPRALFVPLIRREVGRR